MGDDDTIYLMICECLNDVRSMMEYWGHEDEEILRQIENLEELLNERGYYL